MDVIKKQAIRLRDHVAKHQQTVLRQFSGRFNRVPVLTDEAEFECHQNLQKLYVSTKATKHFQQNIAKGVEALISVSSKQMEIVKKLADECCKYGNECKTPGFALSKASVELGGSLSLIEKERETLMSALGDKIFEPLQSMIMGAPLEDARHLAYRYHRIRQDTESQASEVMKRQLKSEEVGATADSAVKLQNAESKLSELRNALSAIGREATVAMTSVEAQQQQSTLQKLVEMVEAERAYHRKVANILDKFLDELVLIKQRTEFHVHPMKFTTKEHSQIADDDSNHSSNAVHIGNNPDHFIAEVVIPFESKVDGELSLTVGDYVAVQQVTSNGWSEGECNGRSGWFPSAYVEQCEKAPATKVLEALT